ncbi:MAG: PepSY domain-containing protein [Thermodesulfobacteriota bacterium]
MKHRLRKSFVMHSSLRRGLLALSLGLIVLPAVADDDCDAPVERWQSREAVRQMAARQGWQIQRLKIDDGCYEIRGTDSQGRIFKAKIDPETLKVLKMKQGDRQRSRERDRERAASQPDGAAAPSSPFTPGTAPRSQID